MDIAAHDIAYLARPAFVQFQRLDLVELRNGQRIIVTAYHPNRPANCYSGVLEGGQGKEYIFGMKHRPTKIGVVTENHPAIRNNLSRKAARDPHAAHINLLIEAVLAGNLEAAKTAAKLLREAGY